MMFSEVGAHHGARLLAALWTQRLALVRGGLDLVWWFIVTIAAAFILQLP